MYILLPLGSFYSDVQFFKILHLNLIFLEFFTRYSIKIWHLDLNWTQIRNYMINLEEPLITEHELEHKEKSKLTGLCTFWHFRIIKFLTQGLKIRILRKWHLLWTKKALEWHFSSKNWANSFEETWKWNLRKFNWITLTYHVFELCNKKWVNFCKTHPQLNTRSFIELRKIP